MTAFGISNPEAVHGVPTPYALKGLADRAKGMSQSAAIFNELLFKIAVRSDRLCILVAGLLDAFVTA